MRQVLDEMMEDYGGEKAKKMESDMPKGSDEPLKKVMEDIKAAAAEMGLEVGAMLGKLQKAMIEQDDDTDIMNDGVKKGPEYDDDPKLEDSASGKKAVIIAALKKKNGMY